MRLMLKIGVPVGSAKPVPAVSYTYGQEYGECLLHGWTNADIADRPDDMWAAALLCLHRWFSTVRGPLRAGEPVGGSVLSAVDMPPLGPPSDPSPMDVPE